MATNFNNISNESFIAALETMTVGKHMASSQLTIEDLLAETKQYLDERDTEEIQRAYELANLAHKGVVRRSGEPYIQHPLEVALLLSEMRIDADGTAAALLHDVVEDTDYSLDDLRAKLGPHVATIVDGVTKFDALAGKQSPPRVNTENGAAPPGGEQEDAQPTTPSVVDKRRQRTETVRKMLLAMAEDPRVVVLKLADRLHNMRTLDVMNPAQQQNKARETSEIYAPLARRLGMANVQADLEDLALSYLEPEKYGRLVRTVEEEIKRRQAYIEKVCRALRKEMER